MARTGRGFPSRPLGWGFSYRRARRAIVTFPDYSTQSGFPGLAVEAALDYPITDGLIGLSWTDLSTSVESVSWSRGRSRETDVFEPGTCSFYLRRPSAPITQWVNFDGSTGNNITTPDSTAASITGAIDLRVKVALDDWVPATEQSLLAKWDEAASQKSYGLSVDTNGTLRLLLSQNGTNGVAHAKKHNIADGGLPKCIRVTYTPGNTYASFYVSDTGQSWEAIGQSTGTALASLYDGTAEVEVGSRDGGANPISGNIYWAEIHDGVDGPIALKFDATAVESAGAQDPTSVPSNYGETWTINGSAWQWGGQNTSAIAPILKPLTHVRIRTAYAGVEREHIHAYVDSWDEEYRKTKDAIAGVTATDGMKILSAVVSPSPWERKILTSSGKRHWYRMNAPSLIPGVGGLTYADRYGYDQIGSAHMLWDVDDGPTESLVKGDSDQAAKRCRLVGAGNVLMTTAFPLTVAAWVTSTSTSSTNFNPTVWGHGKAPTLPSTAIENLLLYLPEAGETPRMTVDAGASFTINSTIDINTTQMPGPHLLVFSWDGTTGSNKARLWHGSASGYRKAYYASPTAAGVLPVSSRQTIIGGGFDSAASSEWDWNGAIDEVVVWGRVLSTNELDALFASGAQRYGTYDAAGGVMNDLLDTIDWPADLRSISTSDGLDVPVLKWHNPKGTNVLPILQDISLSDRGALLMNGGGLVQFIPHATLVSSTLYTIEQLTFSSSAGAVPYTDIKFEYDDQQVINEVQITNEAIVFQTSTLTSTELVTYRLIKQSTEAKDFYMPRSLDLSLNINTSGDPAAIVTKLTTRADYELRQAQGPKRRIKQITVKPMRDPTNLWPKVLGLELLQRVGVKHRTPDGSTISQSLTVEKITHNYNIRARDWAVTFDLGFRST